MHRFGHLRTQEERGGPVMGAPAYLSTDTAVRRAADTSEMHNASVDEDAARKGGLPTGSRVPRPPRESR